jgi:glycosyltransferase involved in cell wall biosynthesis
MGKAGSRFPRVLLVGHDAFAKGGGGGIVLSNLFLDWPRRDLAVIDYSIFPPDLDRCDRYWRLSKCGVLQATAGLPPDGAAICSLQASRANASDRPSDTGDRRGALRRELSRLSVHVRRPIGEAIFRLPGVLSRRLGNWIDAFDPEVCVSMLGSGLMLRTVVRIAGERRIPIVPYFCDDWITTLYGGDVGERWLRGSARRWLAECLRRSPVRLVVTREMAEEYSRRYGGTFLVMEYAVAETEESAPPSDREVGPVRLVYMGSLVPDRLRSLRAMGDALAALAGEGLTSLFSVYVPAWELTGAQDELNVPPVMKSVGSVPYDEVQGVLREADVVVHVESFHSSYRKWTRYSMSTKIPEYMMAGRCIFGYGPGEVSSIRYISESGAGYVVASEDRGALLAGLRTVLSSSALRRKLGKRVRAIAYQRHDGETQRRRFLEAIRLACGRQGDET